MLSHQSRKERPSERGQRHQAGRNPYIMIHTAEPMRLQSLSRAKNPETLEKIRGVFSDEADDYSGSRQICVSESGPLKPTKAKHLSCVLVEELTGKLQYTLLLLLLLPLQQHILFPAHFHS